ncbi:MAG: hypothetical protein CME01_12955 [Geminicoccus sp.]|nr:hypothetical protein [Geminicoccus sp.]
MKSVADLIANKNALIKRDQRGKITAASLTAAGAAVLAASQAQAQGLDGFEDITSSVISFERVGNGQVEFELENGQRFIANEGQYIVDGNQILVSQELVTIVGGPGMNPTVIAVAVAGAALLVGALILLNSDDDDDSTGSTSGTTPSVPGTTTTITPDSTGEATGTAGDDTFTVSGTDALDAITAINGGSGTDQVTLTEVLDPDTSPALDLGSRGVTLTGIEQFAVNVDAGTTGKTVEIDMSGETAALTVSNTNDGEGTITITDLGPSAQGGSSAELSLTNVEGDQKVDVDTDTGIDELVVKLKNAGESDIDPMDLDLSGSSEAITELTVSSDGSSTNSLNIHATSSLTTLNLSGSENLNIENTVGDDDGVSDLSGVTAVDASGASGKIMLMVDDTVETLTMGSGNDEVTVTANGPTSSAVWSGGTGNDTLDLATFGSDTATISDFETIKATSGTIDFTNISDVDDLQVATSATLQNVGNNAIADQVTFTTGASVTISSATETKLEFKGASGADGNLSIANNAAALTELVYEPGTNGTLTLTGTATKDLVIRGSEDVILGGDGIASLTSIDARSASAVTAIANDLSGIADYKGSSGVDNIEIASLAANASIDTGNGVDQITFSAGTGNGAIIEAGAGNDTINTATFLTGGSITYIGGAGIDQFTLDIHVAETLDFDALSDMATFDRSTFNALTAIGDFDTTNTEVVQTYDPVNDSVSLKDLTAVDDVVLLTTAYTAGDFNTMITDVTSRLDSASDIVVVNNFAGDSYVFVDVEQATSGLSVQSIGVMNFSTATLTAADIIA